MFAHSIPFTPADAPAILARIPAHCGVFALHPPAPEPGQPAAEPYISKAANLRRRIQRLLSPPESQSRRLNLSTRVARIDYTATGSDFESILLLYRAAIEGTAGGSKERARKRLRLFTPSCIRFDAANQYPRAYVTNRLSARALDCLYGPFPSRAAAEHYLDESLNFFKLRRCHMELHPDPAYPGCVYSEMKMCLAPCFQGCTDETYAAEAAAVRQYLETRGASLLDQIAARREAASAALEFEQAAALHTQFQKAKSVAQQAAEIVRPLSRLDAVLLQPAATVEAETAESHSETIASSKSDGVAVFLIRAGILYGPALYFVAGMRHANEASGSSSLFAHPVAVEAIPLTAPATTTPKRSIPNRNILEQRLLDLLTTLEPASTQPASQAARLNSASLGDHLALIKRWYYRPQTQRIGEIFFPNPDGNFPLQRIIRGISRVYLGKAATVSEPESPALQPSKV